MALKSRVWYPIAVVGTLANLVGAAFAAQAGEPWHAALHAGLAVAFGVWAEQLRTRRRGSSTDQDTVAEVAELREDVRELGRQLSELQERMDFAERLLTQSREVDRLPEQRREE